MAFSEQSLDGYNKASYWQLFISLHSLPVVQELLLNALDLTAGPITIVDYGSSECYNSMIYFSKLIQSFREQSNREILIIHNDLPDNNWNLSCNLINTSEESYLKFPEVYYSTIGRSFFQQILPNESVHLGFSSFSFHYLSKKPVRIEGDLTFPHEGTKMQARADIKAILTNRINELVKGGTITIIVSGLSPEGNLNLGKLYYLPFVALMDKGIISKEEMQTLEWNTYSMKLEEWSAALDEFKEKIEVVKLEMNKEVCPFYTKFLENNNLEEYKENLMSFIAMISKLQLFSILNKTKEERERIFEIYKGELLNVINEADEISMHMTTLVLKRIS